jgi:hypothetical protein
MSTPSRSADRFWAGVGFGVLIVFSAANLILLLFVVPKFGQIYADALPGKPLPPVTDFILAGRLAIVLINVAWLLVCGYFLHRRNRHSIFLINLATIFNFLQVGTTVIALMMPMVGTTTGMAAWLAGS